MIKCFVFDAISANGLVKIKRGFFDFGEQNRAEARRKNITVYAGAKADKPVIYLNIFGDEDARAREASSPPEIAGIPHKILRRIFKLTVLVLGHADYLIIKRVDKNIQNGMKRSPLIVSDKGQTFSGINAFVEVRLIISAMSKNSEPRSCQSRRNARRLSFIITFI